MQRYIYRLLFFCFLLGSYTTVKAIDEKYAAPPLRGNQLAADSTSMVMDAVYFNPALKPLQTTYFVKNLITFQIDESYRHALPTEFDVSVIFKIHYTYDNNGTPEMDSTDDIILSIGYSQYTKYGFKATYIGNDWYKAEIEIVSINGSGNLSEYRDALVLTNEILINREYNFSCTNNAIQNIFTNTTPVSTKGELNVYWLPERAADEYDLEWTYIDEVAIAHYYKSGSTTQFDPKKLFGNNATRVSVRNESYNIPLLYEASGRLFCRVRAVQVKRDGQRLESVWSSDNTSGLGSYSFAGLDSTLNWQASTSFAEEGKRKSVVQYFDGSLKSRQTVTKDNTTDTTIIAETFYDYQGRPVIQVMPTPSLSSIIKFTPGFNRLNGAEYIKDEYDGLLKDSCYCAQGAPVMDTMYGAAQYYSPENPLAATGYHKYIPDAKGYVFSETRYTPDNTGRVSIQSGVGEPFQIGKGHETNYTYNAADQEELDALFGTEVGNASHYFKNTVRDANGQVSISYVDMHGRTIATALAGKPPVLLDTLTSNKSYFITKKLLDSNSNVVKGTVVESSKGLVVTKAGQHRFIYSLLPDSISIKDCKDSTICYDCIYDLRITITDECNNTTMTNGEPVVINRTNYHLDANCNALEQFPALDTTVYLREGSYLVTKTLTVNQKAMDYYRDSVFLVRNTCKSLEQTIQEEKTLLASVIQCEPACVSCSTALGDWETFRNNYMQQSGIANSDTANYRAQATNAYNTQQEECKKLCDSVVSLQLSIRQRMLADVTPPYGQYANPDSIDYYSVFWTSASRPQPNYQIVNGFYKDENGQAETPYPQNLGRADFIAAFKNSWAETLLQMHPEYLKLKKYEEFATSNTWDQQFGKTETYQQAVAKGYLNPGNFSTHPVGAQFNYNAAYGDPFFTDYITTGKIDGSYKTQMEQTLLDKVRDGSNNAISMWSLATILAKCPTGEAGCVDQYKPLNNAFAIGGVCGGDLDMAWKYFREMYLQKKRDLITGILSAAQQLSPEFANLTDLVVKKHTLNFYDPTAIPVGNDMAANEQAARDSLQVYINRNCASYVQQWWSDLGPCNYNSTDSLWIVPRLLAVCREGGDEKHPFGASTVKPGSINEYKSFDEVLKAYSAISGKSYNATCNAYLLSAPLPYDQQPVYTDKPVFQKPDSCECATLSSLYERYQNIGTDANFAAYLYRTTGTQMTQGALDTLRLACNGQVDCNFLSAPVYLPPVLQCGVQDVCVSCKKFDTLYKKYVTQFPDAKPAQDNGDSLQIEKNKLFERFMNSQLGFGKTVNEYLGFKEECGLTETKCDTLTEVFRSYTQQRLNDSLHFNLYQIVPTEQFTYTRSDVYKNGVAHIPDNYVQTSGWGPHYRKNDTICTGNVFSVVTRIKKPARDINVTSFQFQVHFNDDYGLENIGPHFYLLGQNPTASDTADVLANCGMIGYGRESNYKPPMNPFISDYSDWVEIKLTHGNDNIWRLYYNGNFVNERYVPMPVTRLIGFAAIFSGYADNGYVDYFKVYDQNNQLQYVEDYEDALQSPSNDPAAYRCTDSCQTKFTRYYNQVTNSSLTYAQIQQLYSTCSVPFDGCSYGNNADSLVQWRNDYKKYGGIPHLDASGSDTTYWKSNFSEFNSTTNRLDIPFHELIKNGKLSLPAYYADTASRTLVNFRYWPDTLCLDPEGFTWETRMKLPDSLVNNNWYDASSWFWLYTRDSTSGAGTMLMAVSKVDGMGAAVCTHHWDSKKTCADENIPGQHLNDWRVIRFQFLGRDFKYFIDDSLVAQRTLDAPLTKLNGWNIAPFSMHAQIDYVKMYRPDSSIIYEENFDDPKNLAGFNDRSRCAPCGTRFANYFNQRNGSNLTYAQIDSLYVNTLGISLGNCDDETPVLCGKTEPVFAPDTWKPRTACDDSTLFATSTGVILNEAYRDSLIGNFNDRYLAKCLSARYNEHFTVYQPISEFHYTLYYYDQAGNLLKTVAPEGVNVSKFAWARAWSDSVTSARRNKQFLTPDHKMPTQYRYNTLNQLVAHQSPDGGLSEFWYDRLGRLAISRNARQKGASGTEENRLYSYTKYDSLGRLTEVGQVSNISANGEMTDVISRNQPLLKDWLTALNNRRGQITNTIYDQPYTGFNGIGDPRLVISQRNLRNRVSYTTLTDTSTSNVYNQGTFYTYDILGNVDHLLQDYGSSGFATTANVMNKNDNRWKKISYQYDLISGKVNMAMYQHGWEDGFFHRYSYDSENRLTLVETSRDSLVWEKDARYDYYRHGPLARVTLGDQQVQGLDYAYTLQGWLKGINSTGGTDSFDMGEDAHTGSLNQFTGKDALGLTLNYFANDYAAINGTPFPGYSGYILPTGAYRPLYNGNIISSSVYQKKFDYDNSPGGPLIFYNYKYDQLNRLTAQDAYRGFNVDSNHWKNITIMGENLKERIAYDANGNIQKYLRKSITGITADMDSLNYYYYTGTNQLKQVTDNVLPNAYVHPDNRIVDIDGQSPNNYGYDAIGNLVRDDAEHITAIKWNVYGKIQEINRTATTEVPASIIKYAYDVSGNRIGQEVTSGGNKYYTWYVRDAQGNIMSTYSAEGNNSDLAALTLKQSEKYLYGSSRLGLITIGESVDGGPDPMQYYYGIKAYDRGDKEYELTNHLGNVLATVSDRKFGVTSGSSSLIDHYEPNIVTAQDYYPFGMMSRVDLPGSGKSYKFGFNGKMNDNEVKGGLGNQQDYGMRIYDPRIGKFLSVDPLTGNYPWYTPYQFAGNKPIKFIDRDGAEEDDQSESIWDLLWNALFAKDKMEEGATKVMEGAGQNAAARSRQGSYENVKMNPMGKSIIRFREEWAGTGKMVDGGSDMLAASAQTTGNLVPVGEAISGAKALYKVAPILKNVKSSQVETVLKSKPLATSELRMIGDFMKKTLCFVAGTKVLTNNGPINIEDIVVGDSVFAYNEATQEIALKKVEALFRKTTNQLVRLEIGNESVWTTPDHRFYINGKWKSAKDIRVGDTVLLFTKRKAIVNDKVLKDSTAAVYNFTVSELHSYFVSNLGILVHNECYPLSLVENWSSKTGKTFGHSFTRHGKKMYNSLIGRLETGDPQGHFLNDAAAAKYLESIKDQIAELAPGVAKDFDLPAGLGQVLTKSEAGEVIVTPATKVRVVRGSKDTRSFIKSAFPVNESN